MDSKSTLIIITVLTLSFGFIFNAFPIRSDNIIQGGGAPIIQNIVNGTVGPRGYNGTNGINGVNGTQGPQGPAGVVNGTSASFVNLYANGLVSFNNITSPIFVNYILSKVSEGSGLTASDIWEYVTRTLTNLNDTRADMIDNLDVLLSTRATQSSVDTIDGIVDSILVDTNELQVDWVNGGRLDLLIDAIKAKTDTIVANTATQTSVDTIDGIVDSILVDTNELQVDWVNGGRLDLLIDAIKAKTDTIVANTATQTSVDTIDGIVDSILIDTSEIKYQPGFKALISTYTASPTGSVYYTILDETTSGYLYSIAIMNSAGGDLETYTLKITIDGIVITSVGEQIAIGATEYFYITLTSDIPISSLTPILFGDFSYIPYDTSLKVEVKVASVSVGNTVYIRRCTP